MAVRSAPRYRLRKTTRPIVTRVVSAATTARSRGMRIVSSLLANPVSPLEVFLAPQNRRVNATAACVELRRDDKRRYTQMGLLEFAYSGLSAFICACPERGRRVYLRFHSCFGFWSACVEGC